MTQTEEKWSVHFKILNSTKITIREVTNVIKNGIDEVRSYNISAF
jgi:hypothetical protein